MNLKEHERTSFRLAPTNSALDNSVMQKIVDTLKEKHSCIRDINFRENKIGLSQVKYIVDIIKINKGLEVLDLRHNEIGDEGAMLIAEAMKHNNTLKTLVLKDNKITEKGSKFLLDSVEDNKVLRLLNLTDNPIREVVVENISIERINIFNSEIREINIKGEYTDKKLILFL